MIISRLATPVLLKPSGIIQRALSKYKHLAPILSAKIAQTTRAQTQEIAKNCPKSMTPFQTRRLSEQVTNAIAKQCISAFLNGEVHAGLLSNQALDQETKELHHEVTQNLMVKSALEFLNTTLLQNK